MKASRPQWENLLLLSILFIIIGLGLVFYFWNADSFYTQAYTPMVRQAEETKKAREARDGKPSSQPTPYGFSESDIEKSRGDRYAAY